MNAFTTWSTLLGQAVDQTNNILWSYVLIIMLIAVGLWFTLRTGAVQVRMLPEMFRVLKDGIGAGTKDGHISSFQAFCVSTASRVGVGNIAGIAIAIVTGGPGAVFWMWMIALIGAASGFVESTLGQIYKVPLPEGGFRGGPAYYIRNGLGRPKAAIFFAVLISVTYGLIFNSVQANTIALSLESAFGLNPATTGLVVTLFALAVIFGGITRVAKVTEWVVPIMATIYIITALWVTVVNIDRLPEVIMSIFANAFGTDALLGGGFGAAIMAGIKRGLFSNEAGMGAVPNAAATADTEHPVRQGLVQAFGVFVDTMIVCTASAFIILCTGDYQEAGLTGIALMQHDLALFLGEWARGALAVFIILFAFSSIVGNYYYGEINIGFISRNKLWLNLFRATVGVMIFVGSIAELKLVWDMADLFMALMAITNILAIAALGGQTFVALQDYLRQRRAGIEKPHFHASVLPRTEGIVWWRDESGEAK